MNSSFRFPDFKRYITIYAWRLESIEYHQGEMVICVSCEGIEETCHYVGLWETTTFEKVFMYIPWRGLVNNPDCSWGENLVLSVIRDLANTVLHHFFHLKRAGPVLLDGAGSGDRHAGGDWKRREQHVREWDRFIRERMEEECGSLCGGSSSTSLSTGYSGSDYTEFHDSVSISSELSSTEEETEDCWGQFADQIWRDQEEDEGIWDCFFH